MIHNYLPFTIKNDRFQKIVSGVPQDSFGEFLLLVVSKGAFTIIVNHRILLVNQGEALLLFPGQFYHIPPGKYTGGELMYLGFKHPEPELWQHLKLKILEGNEAFSWYLREFRSAEPGNNKKVDIRPYLLGCMLASLKNRPGSGIKESYTRAFDKCLSIHNYVYNHLDINLELNEIARKFKISESRLRTLFRTEFGSSLGKYISQMRMRNCCNRLIETRDPISDIARAGGYKSVFIFSRAFKKFSGLPPLKFRANFTSK